MTLRNLNPEPGPQPAPQSEADTVPERTKTRLLELLKRHGPQTAQGLAERLCITIPATRRHLSDLQAQTLVQAQIEKPGGRGRPQHVFALTEHGDERAFPKTYSALCLDVLDTVADLYGPEAPKQVLQARSDQLLALLRREVGPQLSLEEKLRRLVARLDELGFDPSLEQQGGRWVLVQGNCPTLQVARVYKAMCASELSLYLTLLGVPVEREEHMACGHRRCRYVIGPAV